MKKKEFLAELKKLAVSAPLVPALDDESNFDKVNKFVTLFNIKEGKNLVSVALIYKVYSDWALKPIKKITFYREFSKLFISTTKDRKVYYQLNYKPGSLVKKGKEKTYARDTIE